MSAASLCCRFSAASDRQGNPTGLTMAYEGLDGVRRTTEVVLIQPPLCAAVEP